MEVIKIKRTINHENLFTNKLRVAAYIRVSTKSELQLNSFESQTKYYMNLINRNNNWTLYQIYSDFGKSGVSLDNRTEFKIMINEALKGKIDFIITKSISRFARNTEDLLKIIRLLKEKNIGVYFEEENINTLSIESEFLLSVLATVAQAEAENISSHISFSKLRKLEKGECLTFARTYGYKYKNGNLHVIKKEAAVVKKIFELAADGKTNREIVDYLNNNKIKTLKNKKWTVNRILFTLRNEIYTGDLIQGRNKYCQRDNLYVVKNNHEAIVSRELFEIVKTKLNTSNQKRKKRDYLYNVYCGFCKRKITINTKQQERLAYLVCRTPKCRVKSTKKEIYENLFIELLIKIVELDSNSNKYRNKINEYNNMLKKYNKEKVNLLDDFMNYKINQYVYNEKLKCINEKTIILEEKINDLTKIKMMEKKGNKIKKEILNKIINYTDDINKFNRDLYYEIVLFSLLGRIDKVRTYNTRVVKFYYNDKRDILEISNKDYLKHIEEFELMLTFYKSFYIRDGQKNFKDVNYEVEFYIRKDY